MEDSLNIVFDTISAVSTDTATLLAKSSQSSFVYDSIPIVQPILHSSWMIGCMLLVFFVYCILSFKARNYIWADLQGVLTNDTRLILHSVHQSNLFSSMLLAIFGVLGIGFYLYVGLTHGGCPPNINWWSLLICGTMVALFLLIQLVATSFFGFTFLCTSAVIQYFSQVLFLISLIGLVSTPLTLLALYGPAIFMSIAFWINVVFIVIVLLFSVVKFVQNFMAVDLSVFYIFLYLCTFKILFVLVYIKLLATNIQII